jgi:peptide/nickel transport system permease protein
MSRIHPFFRRWQNWLSLVLVLAFVFVAIAAPFLSPNDPEEPGPFKVVGRIVESRPQPPDETAILGQLPRGVDVYHALIWGTRDALLFGLIVTIASALFGIIYGAFSGYLGGRAGAWMLRISDSFLAFPPIAGLVFLQQLYISTITFLGGFLYDGVIYSFTNEPIGTTLIQHLLENVNPLMLSLIIFSWMPYARLVHSIVITLKQTDFIQAARALGGSTTWILRKHLLRNSTAPAMVLAARDVGGVVLFQATLTFIGLGGESVWGTMLANGRNWVLGPGGNLLTYWWVFLPPTLAVMLFGIGWNMFGDSLAETLSPAAYVGTSGTSFWSRFRRRSSSPEEAEEELAPVVLQKGSLPAWQEALQANPAEKPFPTPTIDPILVAARANVQQGDLSKALDAYSYLISRGRLVNQLLPELAQLVKKYPRHPQVWQTLGDALAQTGDLEHANQSYAQARKFSQ